MVKRCPNCSAIITAIGEGDTVICWYCTTHLMMENEEFKDKTLVKKELDLSDYDKVYQEESRRK